MTDTFEELKENKKQEVRAIKPAMLRSVMNNAAVRARSCIAVKG